MKHLQEPINLIIDLHALRGALAGKHYYTLGLLNALSNHPLSQNIQFHLVSTTPLPSITNANATWHYFSKSWYYLRLSLLTKTLPNAHLLSPTSFIPPLLSFCPTTIIIYDTASLTPQPFTRNAKAQVLETLLYPWIMWRSTIVLTISTSVARELKKLSPTYASKVMIVYPQLRNFRKANAEFLKKYSLKPNDYLLYVGTLEPRKNLLNLLSGYHQFLAQAASKNQPKLVLAGQKGWQVQPIFDTIQKLKLTNNVVVVDSPKDDDISALYANCLFFCFVSFYEGFGMPVLEAMSFGKAILMSNIDSLNEVALPCAVGVEPTNTQSIALGLKQLTSNVKLRQTLESKTRRQIEKLNPLKQADHFIGKLLSNNA